MCCYKYYLSCVLQDVVLSLFFGGVFLFWKVNLVACGWQLSNGSSPKVRISNTAQGALRKLMFALAPSKLRAQSALKEAKRKTQQLGTVLLTWAYSIPVPLAVTSSTSTVPFSICTHNDQWDWDIRESWLSFCFWILFEVLNQKHTQTNTYQHNFKSSVCVTRIEQHRYDADTWVSPPFETNSPPTKLHQSSNWRCAEMPRSKAAGFNENGWNT